MENRSNLIWFIVLKIMNNIIFTLGPILGSDSLADYLLLYKLADIHFAFQSCPDQSTFFHKNFLKLSADTLNYH